MRARAMRRRTSSESSQYSYISNLQTRSFDNPLAPFWYPAGAAVLLVVPFDCERGQLVINDAFRAILDVNNWKALAAD